MLLTSLLLMAHSAAFCFKMVPRTTCPPVPSLVSGLPTSTLIKRMPPQAYLSTDQSYGGIFSIVVLSLHVTLVVPH